MTNYTLWAYNGTTTPGRAGHRPQRRRLTFDGTDYSFGLAGSAGKSLQFGGYDYAVSALRCLKGDANLDGKVDINDLTIVLAHYNQTGQTWTDGEFTGSGTVDINDLTIVLANYNTSVGSFRRVPAFGARAGGRAAAGQAWLRGWPARCKRRGGH